MLSVHPPSEPRWFSAFARCKKTTCAEIWSSWDVARRPGGTRLLLDENFMSCCHMLQGLKSRMSLLKQLARFFFEQHPCALHVRTTEGR